MRADYQAETSVRSHDKMHYEYEQRHGEIFNPIERGRLHGKLEQAIESIRTTSSGPKIALDYGCGSGNLTEHLIELGLYTIAADVSGRFLSIVARKYCDTHMLDTLKINGKDLSNIKKNYFDLVATYSVLHHVPDYLQIIKEMVRVLKPGGVIYLDHEVNESYWNRDEQYTEFLKLVQPKKTPIRFLKLSYYINIARHMMNPRYQAEGDIHVWPDDHIEWDKVESLLVTQGCDIVLKEDYLLYRRGYPINIYQEYQDKCDDIRVLIARRNDLHLKHYH